MAKAEDYTVAIDDGHGPQTAGKRTPYIAALGRQIRENEFNKAVVNLLDKELKRIGFKTVQTAPTDIDTPLKERTNKANAAKANLLISIHFNAMGNTFAYSSAKGFSVHIQPADKANPNSGSLKFAKLAVEELAKGTAQVNRGVVGQDLHMTRETKMPAVLVECGFMDDLDEAMLMINPSFQREVAQELARAVCRYFGVKYIEEKPQSSKPAAPVKPKPVEKPVTKPKEEDDMLKQAIVIGSLNDYAAAEILSIRKGIPIFPRNAIKGEVAKELIVVGGDKKGLKADKVTNLSGATRFETAENVKKYLK
ncbi:N-acetylmuramoyl-L-alanine amidase [Planococcus sp. YIM B11945]|uniref:N-acetylmuramoyl-L-alanine amidase family protein n=1 Tax=Planococcus sp. YIM B11945 TaxID=3435410 RepID=UPI003D7D4058